MNYRHILATSREMILKKYSTRYDSESETIVLGYRDLLITGRHCVVSFARLVMVQARKTRPFKTEILLMGREESNQTNKY